MIDNGSNSYPADLAISALDFAESGWKEVLVASAPEEYSTMFRAFSAAAQVAIDDGRNKHGKVLELLANACSMMLSPISPNEPFKPIAEFQDRRSAIPDDLCVADIEFFASIVTDIDDIRLKARLADLVWLKKKPRDITFALMAIDAYRAIPLDTETWFRDGRECWKRAISLAFMLRDGAGSRVAEMETSIVASFNNSEKKDDLGLRLATLLKSNGLGQGHKTDVAEKLESLAMMFDEDDDLHRSREYFAASADWYRVIPDESKAAKMTVSVAESLVKEAISQTSTSSPSHMMAASLFEDAIQTYRTIPRSKRAFYQVDQRIFEIRSLLSDAGAKALGEMSVIRSPSVDISQLVERARKSVSGKSTIESLLAFANLYPGVEVDEMRKSAFERMQRFPLSSLFSSTVFSRDGRVVARRPAVGLDSELSPDDEACIRVEMAHDYEILVNLLVQGDILPALEVLLLEHRLCLEDFVELAGQSPIVPKDRFELFGKALFAGYDGDFVIALHLLIPQIEHMVRVHLKQAGAKTSNLDKDGIENENGLSALLELPEADLVFGKNLVFELRALCCDAFGPNLRNELAHGLLGADICRSPFAIYVWWLGFRLILNVWWNTAHKAPVSQGEQDID